jgi:hypothetical protein
MKAVYKGVLWERGTLSKASDACSVFEEQIDLKSRTVFYYNLKQRINMSSCIGVLIKYAN